MLQINKELNGIELSFEAKPDQATLDALKAAGFRWHRVKKVWYAKQTPERLALAQSLDNGPIMAAPAKQDEINLEGLGTNTPSLYGSELAAAIRADLKARGVKGVTVRARSGGYTTSITLTIKATADDMASIEEMKARYPFSEFSWTVQGNHGVYTNGKYIYREEYSSMTDDEKQDAYNGYIIASSDRIDSVNPYNLNNRNYYFEFTSRFYNKIMAVYRIANQWNYDNSDIMTDYHDVGYYLDIDIKKADDFSPRETMTDEERQAYDEELRKEEEERQAQLEEMKRREEESKKAREEAEKRYKEDIALINNNIIVEDLEKPFYITGLAGGIGKEATLEELMETETTSREEALVTRKVTFTTREAYDAFCRNLLADFTFLYGMGGTATEDIRLEGVKNLYSLTTDQREAVKWFMNNCVAIYYNDELKLISNPEGHNYSRYTYYPTTESMIMDGEEETERQAKESEEKPGFYFPEPVTEQVKNLHEGQKVTVYQCDGWILNSIYSGAGTITAIREGKYAQYTGVYITLINGKKTRDVFIRDNHECLIYEGIKERLPDSVTSRRISDNLVHLLNYNDLFPAVLEYYGSRGEKPILDTIQR